MLTKEEIDQTMAELHDGIRSLDIWDALWLMGAQAKQAIDLAAENERLKAKLDAVRAECDKSMLVKNPLKHTECLNVIVDKLKSILAILDKDGDKDA